MLMRLMSKGEYVIVPKGTKFTGAGKLGLKMWTSFMVSWSTSRVSIQAWIVTFAHSLASGVLRFGLDWGVPLDPQNPYPFLKIILKKVPICKDFS